MNIITNYSAGARKPSQANEVNWNHPFAKGLLLCIPATEGRWQTNAATSPPQNVPITIWGNMAPLALSSSTPTLGWTGNKEGTALDFSVNASLNWADFIPLTGVTIAVVRRFYLGGQGNIFGCTTVASTERTLTLCPFNDGTVYWDFGGAGGANRLAVAGLSFPIPPGQADRWVFTAGNTGMAMWRNGVKVGSQSTAVTRTAGTGTALGQAGSVTGAGQEISLLWIVNYPWPDSLCRWWSGEPYDALYSTVSKTYSFLGNLGRGGGGKSAGRGKPGKGNPGVNVIQAGGAIVSNIGNFGFGGV